MAIEFDESGKQVEPTVPAAPSPAPVVDPGKSGDPKPPAVAKKTDKGNEPTEPVVDPNAPVVPGDVPYSRFKEVNDAKKVADDRALKAETLLQERETEIQGLRQPTVEPQQSFQDELFVNGEKVINSLVDGKIQSQQDRINSLELKDVTSTINTEYNTNDSMKLKWKSQNDLHKAIGDKLGSVGLLTRNSAGKFDVTPELYSQGYTMLLKDNVGDLTKLAFEAGKKAQSANETLIDGQGVTGGGSPPPKPPVLEPLNTEEKRGAASEGISEREYQENKYFFAHGKKYEEGKS